MEKNMKSSVYVLTVAGKQYRQRIFFYDAASRKAEVEKAKKFILDTFFAF